MSLPKLKQKVWKSESKYVHKKQKTYSEWNPKQTTVFIPTSQPSPPACL